MARPFHLVLTLIAAVALMPAAIAADMSLAQAEEPPCKESVEPSALEDMIEQCLEVSPATHPPCNGENSCKMIEDEIARGCRALSNEAPAFCAEYFE